MKTQSIQRLWDIRLSNIIGSGILEGEENEKRRDSES